MTETAIETRQHGPGCDCVRCTGFPAGHRLSVRHGAFARLTEQDRVEVEAIAEEIRLLVPDQHDADELAVVAMARTEWRLRVMTAWIAEHGVTRDGEARSLLKHIESAERILQAWADRLGLTTEARFELGLRDAQRRALRYRSFDLSRLSPDVRARAESLYAELEEIVRVAEVEA